MIDKALTRAGIGITFFLMVLELTYINAKSLFYLTSEYGNIDRVFAVIGSLAFSMVTIIVMRKSDKQWPKIVFPVFDSLLVFCGFNLKYYDAIVTGTDNQVRFWLTVFMALFTGFIMYCLGVINYREQTDGVNSDKNELVKRETEINSLQTELIKKESEINSLQCKMESVKTEFNGKESELMKYKAIYLQAERSRILKKKAENRTNEENKILDEYGNTN